jgi:soluble lytic murein transglycosylase-like protein
MRLVFAPLAALSALPAAAATAPMPELPAPPLGFLQDPAPSATGVRDALWPLVRAEAQRQGEPPALADAVAIVETGYTPSAVGGSGEIGMMQVMPSTARMLGFTAPMSDLFEPATNIHYGVTYLARAWAASGGNACRALMKYRAGVGEDGYSPLSIQYCRRAAAWLRGQDATLAQNVASNTPLTANRSDGFAISVNGHPYMHPDLAALVEIADVPGVSADQPRAPAPAPPAVRAWHISGRGAKIQAVVDAALADAHEVHVPDADQ